MNMARRSVELFQKAAAKKATNPKGFRIIDPKTSGDLRNQKAPARSFKQLERDAKPATNPKGFRLVDPKTSGDLRSQKAPALSYKQLESRRAAVKKLYGKK
jgi:hypothetical protein